MPPGEARGVSAAFSAAEQESQNRPNSSDLRERNNSQRSEPVFWACAVNQIEGAQPKETHAGRLRAAVLVRAGGHGCTSCQNFTPIARWCVCFQIVPAPTMLAGGRARNLQKLQGLRC